MEKHHSEKLRKRFRERVVGKKIITLFIKDEYEPMDPALIEILQTKLKPHVNIFKPIKS